MIRHGHDSADPQRSGMVKRMLHIVRRLHVDRPNSIRRHAVIIALASECRDFRACRRQREMEALNTEITDAKAFEVMQHLLPLKRLVRVTGHAKTELRMSASVRTTRFPDHRRATT